MEDFKPGRGRARGRARPVASAMEAERPLGVPFDPESQGLPVTGRGGMVGPSGVGVAGSSGLASQPVQEVREERASLGMQTPGASSVGSSGTLETIGTPGGSVQSFGSLAGSDDGSSLTPRSGSSVFTPRVSGDTPSFGSSSASVTASRASSQCGDDYSMVKTLNEGFNKVGVGGEANTASVVTNYYMMNSTPDFKIHQYRVDFMPIEDNTSIKKKMMRQFEGVLGRFVFDGSVLYRSRPIPEDLLVLKATEGTTSHDIKLKLVGLVQPEDSMYLQFYNVVMRKTMSIIGMEELGRNMYDSSAAIKFPEDKLELWPGFVTAIRNHENGTLLCVEVTHKVLRTNSVLDHILSLRRPGMSPPEYEQAVRAEVEDSIVMTHYNKRTYKIKKVDFTTTPRSAFRTQDGKITTYAQYYKSRYGITINESQMGQPLLVAETKQKDLNKGVTGDIYLIPSLCNPTGISDDMRKDRKLMTKLSEHLHMDPRMRKQKLDHFMRRLTSNAEVLAEFLAWNIAFDPTPLLALARIYPKQEILIGSRDGGEEPTAIYPDAGGDWTRSMKNQKMLVPAHLKKWVIFAPSRDIESVKEFYVTLKRMAAEIGVEVSKPLGIFEYNPDQVNQAALEKCVAGLGDLDMMFFIVPNNALRRYADIKNYTTGTVGVPSQCFRTATMRNKNLNSVATKVVIQMTAKMGGVPWSIRVPMKTSMILGFDVYHCSGRKGQSAGALVGTINPSLTKYCSMVSFHENKSELADNLCNDLKVILDEHMRHNGTLPDRIFMFRDGVGEGQIRYVLEHEVNQMKTAVGDVYRQAGVELPKITFTIVTKKINTRAFLEGSNKNLPVGTVLDTCVTLPERYDFFLVSQDVRQGTVSPTNYNVIYDEIKLPASRMQLLAYKLCHLYYNWSGTVAVPAPCQYAHKLAYLTGVALGKKAKPQLKDKLWYL